MSMGDWRVPVAQAVLAESRAAQLRGPLGRWCQWLPCTIGHWEETYYPADVAKVANLDLAALLSTGLEEGAVGA